MPPGTSALQRCRRAWNTAACCVRKAPCRPAVRCLKQQRRLQNIWPGNILLATGAKELAVFAGLEPARLYPRVLPTPEGIAACEAANVPHRNIIAMQGPFSLALNKALITQFQIRYLVTKDGGAAGGFAEKVQAAADTGAQLVVLRRPPETGETETQILAYCKEILQWSH